MQLDSTYNGYLQAKVLSSAETKELIQRHRNGDKEALEKIVKGNQKLILSIANKYAGNGIEYEDLIQEGNIGLLTAINKFDLTRANTFSTYTMHWIKQCIKRAIEDKGNLIRVPAHLHQLKMKAMQVRASLTAELGRTATNEEIAAELDIDPNEIYDLVRATCNLKSIDEQNTDNQNNELGALHEILEDTGATQDFKDIDDKALLEYLDKILKPYDERRRYIFKARHGLGQQEKSLQVLASELGISRQRVSDLCKYVENGIRKSSVLKTLKELVQ